MPSEDHISSFYTSLSVHALMLLTGLCLGLLLWSRKECMRDGWLALISHLERRYNDTPRLLAWLTARFFCLLSTSLALYVACSESELFVWSSFGWVVLLVGGCKILIDMMMLITGYVFDFRMEVRVGREQRMSLWILISLVLFIETAVAVYRPMPAFITVWFPFMVMAVAVAIIGIKLIRVFLYKPQSLLYIAVYWLTVEVIPVAAVWCGVREII